MIRLTTTATRSIIGCTQMIDVTINRESNNTISGKSKIPLRITEMANACFGLFTAWKKELIVIVTAYNGIERQSLRMNCVAYYTVSVSLMNSLDTGVAKISRNTTMTVVVANANIPVTDNIFLVLSFFPAP